MANASEPNVVTDNSDEESSVYDVLEKCAEELAAADAFTTTNRSAAVKLRMTKTGPGAEPPVSIPRLLMQAAEEYPDRDAMYAKACPGDSEWTVWTYSEYLDDVRKAAKSLIHLGVEPFHGVGIIGFNAPEWFVSHLGAMFIGALGVGIYTTNNPEACHYVLNDADCQVCVVENDHQLQKILKVWDRLPNLKAVVQYVGDINEPRENVYTWSDFMELGAEVEDATLDDRLNTLIFPNKCCALVYTSGTTGNPKGAMISHDNMIWTASMCLKDIGIRPHQMHVVSYLPLSHMAALMLDLVATIINVGIVFFAQPDALRGSLVQTLKEINPTIFFAVPRVWEKFQEGITAAGKKSFRLTQMIVKWAKDIGYRGAMSRLNGQVNGEGHPWGWALADYLVFQKVRENLGLDRCVCCITGAAPISKETLDFFLSFNIPLLENYGMTESTGPHTISLPWSCRPTSIGKEFPGAKTKFVPVAKDDDSSGQGEEICMFGRHVFMGYLNMEEKTKEALDEEGWLHSGDVGTKDSDGFLHITGRIKELLVTSGGENVPPVHIEDLVKAELPVVSNCMLVGDKKKFLSMLLTLKTEPDGDNVSDRLTSLAIEWCESVGSKATRVSEILASQDPAVFQAIQAGIDRANEEAVSNAQKIRKWLILPTDFSIPGGELGPTMKVRRPIVCKMYEDLIQELYTSAE